MRVIELGLLDKRTGELYDAEIRLVRKNTGGKWLKIYQDTAKFLADRKIRGASLRVLFFLISQADYQNKVPNASEVARRLGVSRPSVSRAYGELKFIGMLVVKDRTYYLNPFLCWKGSQKQLEEARYELFHISHKELTNARIR